MSENVNCIECVWLTHKEGCGQAKAICPVCPNGCRAFKEIKDDKKENTNTDEKRI